MKKIYRFIVLLVVIIVIGTVLLFKFNPIREKGTTGKVEKEDSKSTNVLSNGGETDSLDRVKKDVKVTFIELGSIGCVPCKMMVPIMKEIEKEYGDQVEVIFYDVKTSEGKPYAEKYKISLIPTQVFLDMNGNEYFRHEGFFPKDELVKVLKIQGVE